MNFFKKILSLRSRDLIMGKIGSNFFYCIFGIRMTQFVKKSKKKITFFFTFPKKWGGKYNSRTRFFSKNRALSLFLFYYALILCKKLEQSNDGKYDNFGALTTTLLGSNSTKVENCNVLKD